MVAHDLEARERQRVPGAVAEVQAVEHPLASVGVVDEEVEQASLHRKSPAHRLALDPAPRDRRMARIGSEPVEVVGLDRQVEHQRGALLPAQPLPLGEVLLTKGHVALHLLGKAHAGHVWPLLLARSSGLRSGRQARRW